MKTIATVTSKGQVTIPKPVRDLLGLGTGDSLEFSCERGRVELRSLKPRRTSAGALNALLPQGWKPPSVAEMDLGIARELGRKRSRQ